VKLSDLTDEQWFARLSGRRNANLQLIRERWAYYDNEQPMYHVARILSEQDNKFPPLTINWCRKYIRSIDGRSILEGFAYVGQDSLDEKMQQIMLRNELDLRHSLNNTATMVTGWSYAMAGKGSDGALVTIESPDSMAVERDPLTGEVRASLKFWSSDVESGTDDLAVMQLPDPRGGSRLITYELGKPVGESRLKWMTGPSQRQASGLVPVVPFLNQERWGKPNTQMSDLIPIVDAANFTATSMMATILRHAMPRILAVNIESSMFLNADGTVNREALKAATGEVWMVPAAEDEDGALIKKGDAPEVDIKQLPASDLRNFHETMNLLARIGAGLCDLTPVDLGFGVSDNPPSADSIDKSKDERLLGIERFNRQQGAGYERLMRYALAVEGEDVGKRLIESKFRNVATPTKQSMAVAATGTLASGISDLYQARRDYGYTPTEIEAMEERERNLARDPFRLNAEDEREPDNGAADAPPAGS
jgi:hypothetical protein